MIEAVWALFVGLATGPIGVFLYAFCIACIVIAIILSIRNHRNHF